MNQKEEIIELYSIKLKLGRVVRNESTFPNHFTEEVIRKFCNAGGKENKEQVLNSLGDGFLHELKLMKTEGDFSEHILVRIKKALLLQEPRKKPTILQYPIKICGGKISKEKSILPKEFTSEVIERLDELYCDCKETREEYLESLGENAYRFLLTARKTEENLLLEDFILIEATN